MLTDYHNHLLPSMDDGARDPAESQGILRMLQEQGISRVAATPHFYSHREEPAQFLARRDAAVKALQDVCTVLPPLLLGAEVRVEAGLSEREGLDQLVLAGSRLMLLELPYAPFKPWMVQEICNIAYQFDVRPIIAHLNRYLEWYKKDELVQILSIPAAVIQLNNEAVLERKALRFSLQLIHEEYPVVLGSDAHNLDKRPPNFDRALPILQQKLGKQAFSALTELQDTLIVSEGG